MSKFRKTPKGSQSSILACKKYHASNKDKRNMECRTYKTGISAATYRAMIEDQNRQCAICEKPMIGVREICIDHNHDTGEIRALLCRNCNAGIGFLKDSAQILYKASEYLKSHDKVITFGEFQEGYTGLS